MRDSKSMLVATGLLVAMTLLPACNRKMQTADVRSEGQGSHPAAAPSAPPTIEAIPSSPRSEQVPQSAALGMPSQLRDVFFDFDRSAVRKDARSYLEEDAKLLRDHPKTNIKVEGHCDERGTVEYNLALGNRRAEAVKRYLIDLGVDASRISIISYGKEKPFCSEHNEACYQKNRRGHFVSLTVEG